MASYPASVKTFGTKNAGDTIQPSHVNELQDEVTAIEDGLLNGSAPVNSSRITAPASQITNSTVTNLTATNSTVANLNVTTGSTFADLNVVAGSPTIIVSGAASSVNTAGITFSFNTQVYASHSGMHSTASNPTQVKPYSTGVYLIIGQADWVGNAAGLSTSGYAQMFLRVDGSSNMAGITFAPVGGGNIMAQQLSLIYRFASTSQYVEFRAAQSGASTGATPTLSMTKLR